MALSVGELAVQIRVATDSADVPVEITEVLTRIHSWASAEIDRLAPSAPAETRDMAVIQIAAYAFDRPSASPGTSYANALMNSGAASILKPYIKRRAVII